MDEAGTAELRAALTIAKKTAVVFDANLGCSQIGNRSTLNCAFSAEIRDAALKKAEAAGGDAPESIRLLGDAVSCADNIEFLCHTSSRKVDNRDPENPVFVDFFTIQVRLDFPDRGTRIPLEKA